MCEEWSRQLITLSMIETQKERGYRMIWKAFCWQHFQVSRGYRKIVNTYKDGRINAKAVVYDAFLLAYLVMCSSRPSSCWFY